MGCVECALLTIESELKLEIDQDIDYKGESRVQEHKSVNEKPRDGLEDDEFFEF